jgi:hypothetical protein
MQKLATAIQQQCDALFAPLYYPFVCVMLSLLVIFTGVRGQAFTRAWDEWMVADWLISYAPGVVRRGLSGELILRASSVAGVPANDLVLAVVVVLFATLCILFTRLLRGKRITFWYFWLCVSPASCCSRFTIRSRSGGKSSCCSSCSRPGPWRWLAGRRAFHRSWPSVLRPLRRR